MSTIPNETSDRVEMYIARPLCVKRHSIWAVMKR